jgi:hypothetical protein
VDVVGLTIWAAILFWLAYAIREYWRSVRPRLDAVPRGPRRYALTVVAAIGAPIFAIGYFVFEILDTPAHRAGDPSASRAAPRIGPDIERVEDEVAYEAEIGTESPLPERIIDQP